MIASILLGTAGLVAGLYISKAVYWIVGYKSRAKEKLPVECFPRIIFFLLSFFNTIVWALAGLLMDSILSAILTSILFTTAIIVALIDLHIRLIPNELVLLLLVAGFLYQIADRGIKALPGALLCMLGMMVLFTAAAGFVGFGKVGAGDVKLAGAMGLTLGYPNIITALLVLCASLFLYSIIGLLARKLTLKSMLPFGPFMTMGMAVTLLCTVFQIVPFFLTTL